MNLKKILMISIVVMAIMASFSVVSAGWFDFSIDTSSSQENEKVALHGNIIDSLVTYEWGEETYKTIDHNGNLTTITYGPSDNGTQEAKREMNYEGYLIINLTNLSDDEINLVKKMLDDGYELELILDVDKNSPIYRLTGNEYNYTVSDKILNITFTGIYCLYNYNGEEIDFSSGSVPLKSYTFYECIGSNNSTLSGDYSK